MIAADTNVLARFLLNDDDIQTKLAAEFILQSSNNGTLYLSPFMIMELVWLLKSKGLGRHHIVPILEKLLESNGISIGQKNVLTLALDIFRKYNLSFSDCLIAADAEINANAKTATFDEAMIKANINCCSVSSVVNDYLIKQQTT